METTENNVNLGETKILETIPVGPLGLISLKSSEALGQKVDAYLVKWREKRAHEHKSNLALTGYQRETFLLDCCNPRFGSGEGKGLIKSSVRGDDIYILLDVLNHSITYSLRGQINHMSPDDHFQDLKRVIGAVGGKARRITVIMPFLYESRQHKRTGRESLDCAMALHELINMGVENILTFDAHDPRVQNAIPYKGFENIPTTYQFVKNILRRVSDLQIDSQHMMILSPDEGGTQRAVYMANVLGLDMGIFYKRRDYSQIVNGRNPIVAHEYLGPSVEGKDIIILDDMISSGDSMIDVATELKKRNANRVFVTASFGLFTDGLKKFDEAYEKGLFDYVVITNLVYLPPELLDRPYFIMCDMSKYIALLIDTLNHDESISHLLNPIKRIHKIVRRYYENGRRALDTIA